MKPRRGIYKQCEACGKEFYIRPYRISEAKYCNRKCASATLFGNKPTWNKGIKTGLIPKTAFKKGVHLSQKTEFKKGNKPWHTGKKNAIRTWNKGIQFKQITGKNHWNWKGGKSPQNIKIRNSIEYRIWRRSVFERDKFTCQRCGQIGGKLNAHHVKEFAFFPQLRFDISNGKTLCVNCHKKEGTYKGKKYAATKTI